MPIYRFEALGRALCACVAFFSAVPAFAQVNTLATDNPREKASINIGPLYATPRLELTDFGVATDVFDRDGQASKDFMISLRPASQLWVPIARRALVKADLGVGLVWFKKFASERSVDPALSGRAEIYLRRFTLFGEGTFLRSRERPTFEIDLRSRRVETAAAAGVDIRLAPKLAIELRTGRTRTEFDGDAFFLGTRLQEKLNRTSTGVGVTSRYRKTVLTTFLLRAERFEERFPLAPERAADNVRVMGGVQFQPRALITGSAQVGVRHLNALNESLLPDFAGFVSDLSLSSTVGGANRFTIRHRRDVAYSFEAATPYFIDTGVALDVRRALGIRFDLIGTVSRNTYDYQRRLDIEPAVLGTPERLDRIWNFGASAGYRLGREARIGFGFTYWTRDSTTETSRRDNGLRIGSTATYGF